MMQQRWRVQFKDGIAVHVEVPAIGLVIGAAIRAHAEKRNMHCNGAYENYWQNEIWCVQRTDVEHAK